MAIQKIVSVFFLLLVLMHKAAGSLRLDVIPYNISPGFTQSLTVNCTFTYAQVSNITGLISLIISKSDQQETFQDLISINAFSPDQITVLSQVDGSMLGHIYSNGESFLTIQWIHPEGDNAGMYKCEAIGMDNTGHASELTQTVMVTSEEPDMNQLIQKFNDLQRQLDRQDNQTNYLTLQLGRQQDIERNQSQNIDYLNSQLERQQDLERNQSQNIDYLNSQLERQQDTERNQSRNIDFLNSQLDRQQDIERNQSQNIYYLNSQLDRQENITSHQSDLIDTLLSLTKNQSDMINKQQTQLYVIIEDRFGSDFRVSGIYQNHVYFLAGYWYNITNAAKRCEDNKGYVAEIDDSAEDKFLNEFFNSLTDVEAVVISGTDLDHDGEYTYVGSSRNMSYIDWYRGEPSRPELNPCILKYKAYYWQMQSHPCFDTYSSPNFLCEVNLE